MLEMHYGGNIFLLPRAAEAAAVTTNGIVKNNGLAVMGAGIAKYARDNLKGSDEILGQLLKKNGNHAYFLGSFQDPARRAQDLDPAVFAVTLPTKNDWRDKSDLDLIKKSCRELMGVMARNNIRKVYIPKPGCSNGGLDYITQVRPAISGILDDRIVCCLDTDTFTALHGTGILQRETRPAA